MKMTFIFYFDFAIAAGSNEMAETLFASNFNKFGLKLKVMKF